MHFCSQTAILCYFDVFSYKNLIMHCEMYFSGQLYLENMRENQHLEDIVYLRRSLVLLYSQELAVGKS